MRVIFLAAFLVSTLVLSTAAQERVETNRASQSSSQMEAKKELNEAARAYRDGNFAEAQSHSERALQLDPNNRAAPFFVARTIHAQFKPGDNSEVNSAKGRDAIAAYQRLLSRFPDDDEAYKAVAYLYGAIKEDELQCSWIFKRAADSSIEPEKRAEAYIVLASKDWDCSFKVTELPTSKITEVRGHKAVIHYRKPQSESDFSKASQCASSGLEMAEMAITLMPENEDAWSYKTNLLLELGKLAEMSGDRERKAMITKEYEDALRQTTKLKQEP